MIRTNNNLLSYINNLKTEYQSFFIEEHFDKKTVIAKEGSRIKWIYIIKEGITKCSLTNEEGKEFIQEFFGKGMKFGELEAINDKAIYCSMSSITKVVTYKISHKNFHLLLNEDAEFNHLVLLSLVTKISNKGPRFALQQQKTVKDNIDKLLVDFPDILNQIPKQDVANYLGITIRSFNRVLSEIKKPS